MRSYIGLLLPGLMLSGLGSIWAQSGPFGPPAGGPAAPPPAANYQPPDGVPAIPATGSAWPVNSVAPGPPSGAVPPNGPGSYAPAPTGPSPYYGPPPSYGLPPYYGPGPYGASAYGAVPGSQPAFPIGNQVPPTRWTFSADVLLLQRTVGQDNYLGQTYNFTTGNTVANLTAGDAGFSMQPGVRFQLGLRVSEQVTWEGVYYGLQSFSTGRTITADPVGAGTVASSPYTQTDWLIGGFGSSLGYVYNSQLNNFEINRVRQRHSFDNWSISTLIGFRYLAWDEYFNLNGYDAFYPAYENITIHSDNNLLGGQLGFKLQGDWNRFHLQMTGKSALMANITHISGSNLHSSGYVYGSPAGFVPYASGGTVTSLAGVLDFSAVATYEFGPHVAMRGGYQLLYIPGLALAPGQLDDTVHRAGVFLHGPMAGIEFKW